MCLPSTVVACVHKQLLFSSNHVYCELSLKYHRCQCEDVCLCTSGKDETAVMLATALYVLAACYVSVTY